MHISHRWGDKRVCKALSVWSWTSKYWYLSFHKSSKVLLFVWELCIQFCNVVNSDCNNVTTFSKIDVICFLVLSGRIIISF